MGLHVHRGERTDVLADALADLLAEPLPDPFATELVVVPAKGLERWLSQRLSHRLGAGPAGDGVCAAVEFRSPGSLVAEITGVRDDDPWAPEALAWPLLDVLDACLGEPWAGTLARHLGRDGHDEEADLRRGRRFSVARRLAGLFASYAGQRPALLAAWAVGDDSDGAGGPLDHDLAWQPELWRRLADRVAAPGPLERHRDTIARLREDPEAFDLPTRLSLFGHTRLSVTDVALLDAVGAERDVHVWLPHPSPTLWESLVGLSGAVERAVDDSHRAVRHPLLSSLGRDTRELQRTLSAARRVTDTHEEPRVPGSTTDPHTLLQHLQSDLAVDQSRPEGRLLDPDDRSVQVHACHGVARQVDVLREVLLGLLADDPTLEPRDVLVMCPDIDTYAPLIEAGFGLGDVVGRDGHPAHRLRVRLADRSPVQTNPLLAVARALLDIAGGRAPATQVLDLARCDPVRRRFGFTDDDLEQLDVWARESGVRWAFDAEHRTDYGLASYVANTWEFGLDRLLTGVALSDDSSAWLDRALPLDDVGSAQVDLVGRLTEYVERLRAATDGLTGIQPLEAWLDALDDGVASVTAVSSVDGWQAGQVQRELSRVRRAAAGLGTVDLRLPDVRALFSDRLAGRPTRANFRTGTLTVCTMVPMRSVPHRVVCLLGLDDGVFPRQSSADGDDVLARRPLTGERDARSEDRQLLLDAILAATETLVVTYTGANEYSGQPRPPAVPLGEVLDALDGTSSTVDGRPVSEAVTVCHPLQPFDVRNVSPGGLVPGTTFSFDAAAAAGARAATGPRVAPAPFLDGDLPPVRGEDVSLADLVRFWTDPIRGFLGRDGVDVALPTDDDQPEDSLPVEIDNLARWAVGDRVLTDLLAGLDPDQVAQREWRRGILPPGRLGWRLLDDILRTVRPLHATTAALRSAPARAVDVTVELGPHRRLTGTVPEVYGARLVPVTYSRLGAKHRLSSWIQLLALTASDADRNWTAHTVGRPTNSRSRDDVAVSLLGPLDHTAADVLRDLVVLRDRGLRAPLPLPSKSALGYARARRAHADVADALVKARYDWKDGKFPGEQSDPAVLKIWGRHDEPPEVGDVPRTGEDFPGETGRFGALAMRLWSPLIEAEQGSW